MDKRVQKAIETEALQSLAKSAEKSAATLEDVVARLERIEQSLRDPVKPNAPQQPKGGR